VIFLSGQCFCAIVVGEGECLWVGSIFARISPNLPEKCLCEFCRQIFSHKDHFWYDFQKNVFMCFSANVGRHSVFVARILPRFSGILPRFLRILPGVATNQNFSGCSCTPWSPSRTPLFYATVVIFQRQLLTACKRFQGGEGNARK